jgi:transcriptional regulator with XRE-family HTH domain
MLTPTRRTPYVTFADNLRRTRAERYLTQSELAQKVGVSKQTIHRLEAGKTSPSLPTLRELAKALGVTPADLARPDEVAEQKKLEARAA